MITFAGVVTLEDDRVPVTIGIDRDEITLVSGQVEIGKWPAEDCTFLEKGDGSWVIEADHDSVAFLPDDPGRFAKGLSGHPIVEAETISGQAKTDANAEARFVVREGPRPRPMTLIGFYALAAVTAALGVWAFINVLL